MTPLHNCRTCKHAELGKPEYGDPEYWCFGLTIAEGWVAARIWLDRNELPTGRLRADADGCPGWREK